MSLAVEMESSMYLLACHPAFLPAKGLEQRSGLEQGVVRESSSIFSCNWATEAQSERRLFGEKKSA